MKTDKYFLNILYKRGNIIDNIRRYLIYNDGNGYLRLTDLLLRDKFFKYILNIEEYYSKHFDNPICNTIILQQLSVDRIALFLTTLIKRETLKINQFIKIKNEFEYCILSNNYTDAKRLLMQAYNNYGVSLWLLDSCSILNALSNVEFDFLCQLGEFEHINYDILNIKNNLDERHLYYVKRWTEIFSSNKIKNPLSDHFKYLLFIDVPKSENEWKNILLSSCNFSIIDIYLALIDYLQKFSTKRKNAYASKCYDYIIDISDPKNKIMYEIYSDNLVDETLNGNISKLIDLFDKKYYEDVINLFFSNSFIEYSSLNAYILTVISFLMLQQEPENSTNVLFNTIVQLIYFVLKKDSSSALNAIDHLARISRLLKTFDIHKSLCVFLELVANYKLGYDFYEQFTTVGDVQILHYEFESNNIVIIPYKCTYTNLDENIIQEYIQKYENKEIPFNEDTSYYFEEAYIALKTIELINKNEIEKATSLIVEAYIKNKLLIYTIDVEKIVLNIKEKVNHLIPLTINEVCYIFIDNNLKEIQRDSFLDLFDNMQINEPLQFTCCESVSHQVISFFLNEICNITMLSNLYWLFSSSEEVNRYRIEICDYLINDEMFFNKKSLLDEVEEITKNYALNKKLKEVDKSRITINSDAIKYKLYDKINEEINIFNSSKQDLTHFDSLEHKISALSSLFNVRFNIVKNIYNMFCREFCFGDFGLDISLSTRVRHGTLSNQVLKIFSDNHLNCNGHGSNTFFDKLIKNGSLSKNFCNELLYFTTEIQQVLDYFTQHTLKVFIDEPIEGALFNYELDTEIFNIITQFINISNISFDDVASYFYNYLINKTNNYLDKIRTVEIVQLKTNLLDKLTNFLDNTKKYITGHDAENEINRLVINCKTGIQNELLLISQWFTLSEYNNWEDYTFEDLIETSKEIDKSLFSDFEKIKFKCSNFSSVKLSGDTFRHFIDIVLIIFNNAINHSGYKDTLSKLEIDYSLSLDSKYLYMAFENNLDESIDLIELDKVISKINDDCRNKKYLKVNTRQEGGMGLYKTMHIIFTVLKHGNKFYISRNKNIFRVEIQLKKELICNEENIDS